MKKTLQSFALLIAATLTFNASAQIPDYGVWPAGVVFTDLNGGTYDIDAILDSGKPVIIDAFAVWCGPCWSYSQAGHLQTLHTDKGPDGTDEVVVLAVESDQNTSASIITGGVNSIGDWTAGFTYPMINDDNLAGIINQGYYPTIIMICPDRTVTEVGQKSALFLYNRSLTCGEKATDTNDPKLLQSISQTEFCQNDEANMAVVLQNKGTTPLTSATIEVFEGTTLLLTTNWTGNLETYEYEEVSLGTVVPTAQTTYSIEITSTNDDVTNDKVSAIVKPAAVLEIDPISKSLTVELNIDNYTSEVGIIFDKGSLNPMVHYPTLHSGGSSALGFKPIGTYANGASPITEEFTVQTGGCHYVAFIDAYGDGYVYQKPSSTIKINGLGTSSLSVDPDFGIGTYRNFDVQYEGQLGINNELLASSFKAYPNPANNIINVEFELNTEEEVTISIINTVGQTVATENLGKVSGVQTTQMNISNLESGVYIVKVRTSNGEKTQRISIL